VTPKEAKDIRLYLGLTQNQLARKLGKGMKKGRNTISRYENGVEDVPKHYELALKYLKKKG